MAVVIIGLQRKPEWWRRRL